MRRFGFVLFAVGLFFVILALGQWYLTGLMFESRMLPGVEAAQPWYLLPAAAGLLIMGIGLCLRLACRN